MKKLSIRIMAYIVLIAIIVAATGCTKFPGDIGVEKVKRINVTDTGNEQIK